MKVKDDITKWSLNLKFKIETLRNKFHLKFGFLYKGTDCGYPSALLMRDLYMTLSIFIQGSGERLYI